MEGDKLVLFIALHFAVSLSSRSSCGVLLTGNINTPLADITECLIVYNEFYACFDKS